MKENIAPSSLSIPWPKSVISVVSNLYPPFSNGEDQLYKAREAAELPQPFNAAFGSLRQRHGHVLEGNPFARTVEAPAKIESSTIAGSGVSKTLSPPNDSNASSSPPSHGGSPPLASKLRPHYQMHHKGKPCSSDLDREAAWERKKEQYLLEEEEEEEQFCHGLEEYDADEGFEDDIHEKELHQIESPSESADEGDEVDDSEKGKPRVEEEDDAAQCYAKQVDIAKSCIMRERNGKKKSTSRQPIKPLSRTRTRSLTDEDMDELQGSIDLGFGFSYNERSNLSGTLPALELYYAVNRNFVDSNSMSSPASPLDGSVLVRTNSVGSTSSPSNEAWRVSSPGDHPTQVKTRLRHWAQAVACSMKQGY